MWFPTIRHYPGPEFRIYVGKGSRHGTRRVFTVARVGARGEANLRTHDIEEPGTADQKPDLARHLDLALRKGRACARPFAPLAPWDTASRPWVLYYADLSARAAVGRTLIDLSWEARGLRTVTEPEMRMAMADCEWQGGEARNIDWSVDKLTWVRDGLNFAADDELAEVFAMHLGLHENVVAMPVVPVLVTRPAVRPGATVAQ